MASITKPLFTLKIGPYLLALWHNARKWASIGGPFVGEETRGFFDPVRQVIAIKPGGSPMRTRLDSVHEATHAIIFAAGGLGIREGMDRDEIEEMVVCRLESGLLALIRDNPDFITWLQAPAEASEVK